MSADKGEMTKGHIQVNLLIRQSRRCTYSRTPLSAVLMKEVPTQSNRKMPKPRRKQLSNEREGGNIHLDVGPCSPIFNWDLEANIFWHVSC